MPELPDEPSDEQVDAWIELAELVRDEDFRARLRAMGRRTFAKLASEASGSVGDEDGAPAQPPPTPTGREAIGTAAAVGEKAGAAPAAGTDPASNEGDAIHDELVATFAALVGRPPDEEYRRDLLEAIRTGSEPRAERYWQLIAIINGWRPIPSTLPAWAWFAEALAARLPDSA